MRTPTFLLYALTIAAWTLVATTGGYLYHTYGYAPAEAAWIAGVTAIGLLTLNYVIEELRCLQDSLWGGA